MTPFESGRFVIFEDPAAFWQVNPKYLATFGQPHFLFYSASSQLSNLVAVLLEELDPLSPRLASRVNDWHISARVDTDNRCVCILYFTFEELASPHESLCCTRVVTWKGSLLSRSMVKIVPTYGAVFHG